MSATRTTHGTARFLVLIAIATITAACAPLPTVSDESATVDLGAIADMPVDAAVNFLNRYDTPAAAQRSTTTTILGNMKKYRCRFGAQSTEILSARTTLPNPALRYFAKRITVNEFLEKQGLQNGVGVRVEHADRATAVSGAALQLHCALAWFPENYPKADLARELNRLATALAAIGIARGQ